MIIGEQPKGNFKENFKLRWNLNKKKYLGIRIPSNLDKLYDCNFQVMENKIRHDMNR